MRCLIEKIGRVIYLSTQALARFDPKLNTFMNVNAPADLGRIEQLLSHRGRR
jgi:molybdopterin-guanine dinucleotide biosynthesis protein A